MKPETFHDCLSRLIPHVEAARIALTGGMAIGVHADRLTGAPSRRLTAEDIDFVAEDVEAVRPTVARDFLISHFHLPQPGYPKFMIQIADPVTRLRVDFFPDSLGALDRAPLVSVGSVQLRVLQVHDLLAHKLALLSKASAAIPIEQKHYTDAQRLAVICGRAVPPGASSHLTETAFSQNREEVCRRCHASRCDAFPLASKRAIFDVLGYV
jgi:hypothetical protein